MSRGESAKIPIVRLTKYVSVGRAASLLGVSRVRITQMYQAGSLRAKRLEGSNIILIIRKGVEDLVKERRRSI